MMTSKRGIFLAMVFILPVICCLVGIGAFVNLTVTYQEVDQEQQAVMWQQLIAGRTAVKALRENLNQTSKKVSKLQSNLGKEKNIAKIARSITEETKQQESSAKVLESRLRSLDAKLGQVQSHLRRLKDESRKLSGAQSSIEELWGQLAGAEKEHARLTSELDAAKKDIEESGNSVFVTSLSGGSFPLARPATFIECTAEGVIIQPQKKQLNRVPGVTDRGVFLSAARRTCYAVFLVRPDGFESFGQYHDLVLSENQASNDPIDVGYEPVNADWRLVYPEPHGKTYANYKPH